MTEGLDLCWWVEANPWAEIASVDLALVLPQEMIFLFG